MKEIFTPKLITLLDDIQKTINVMAKDNPDDGGTCNFDHVRLDTKGRHLSKIIEFNTHSSVQISTQTYSGFWKNTRAIEFKLHGQANQRTRGAEYAYNKLKDEGYSVSMFYQMD